MNVAKLIQQQRHFHSRVFDSGANAIRRLLARRRGVAAGRRKRGRGGQRVSAMIGLVAMLLMPGSSVEVHAIDIQFEYVVSGHEVDLNGNGTTLDEMMQLLSFANNWVAPYWEDIFHGTHLVEIDISWNSDIGGWASTSGTSNTDGIPDGGVIKVHPNPGSSVLWWFDDNPLDHSEFDMTQELYRDLNSSDQAAWFNGNVPDLLEVSYAGGGNGATVTAVNGDVTIVDNVADIFTSLLHETGHVLGLGGALAREEVDDEPGWDFDVPSVLVGGNTMAIEANSTAVNELGDPDLPNRRGHVAANPYPLMCGGCASRDRRRLPSAVDVFAIMACASWDRDKVDLFRQDFFSGVSWNTAGNWEGNRVPGSADDASIRHGGTVSLNASDQVKNLYVGEHSSLDLNDYSMTVTNDTIVEHDGTSGLVPVIRIDPNGDLHTEDLRLFGGGLQLFGGNALVDDFVEITSQDRDGTQVGDGHIVGEGLVLVEGGLRNNGNLVAGYGGTLRFESSAAAPWNLDGSGSEDGSVKAQAGSIEFGSGGLNDEFDGEMYVGDGVSAARRYISFAENWTLGDQGRLIMRGHSDNSFAHRAEITGNGLMTVRGEITASNYSRIDTAVIVEDSATVDISGADSSLRFAQGHATIYNGGTFTGQGTLYQNSDAVVQNDSTVNFGVGSLDLDGLSDAITFSIGSGAVVNLTGEHLTDAFDGTLTMSGDSTLNVDLADDWMMSGQLTVNNGSGAKVAGGSRFKVAGNMHVDEGWGQIHAESLFGNGSELQIDSDGHLVIWADTQFFHGAIVNVDGTLQVFGDMAFAGDATIGPLGNIEVYGDFDHHGEAVDVDSGGRVVYLGDVAGPGDFTGLGDVLFEGEYRPGGSTASVSFAGDVYFGDHSTLVLEVGGTQAGDEYDQLLIDGLLSMDGLVEVLQRRLFAQRWRNL